MRFNTNMNKKPNKSNKPIKAPVTNKPIKAPVTNKPIKAPVTINTLSIQRRIYPEIVDKIAEISHDNPGMTPTKVAAGLLSKQLCLPEPVRKNKAKDKNKSEEA